jgi:hypothetical protein
MLETHVLHIAGERVTLRWLASGDLAVYHRPAEHVRALVEPICRNRGHWNSEYNNWIVFRQFRAAVVSELEAEADHV